MIGSGRIFSHAHAYRPMAFAGNKDDAELNT
jgi:hypothetical protein